MKGVKVTCHNCGGELKVVIQRMNEQGRITCTVEPCVECARRQVDSGYSVGRAHKEMGR